MFAALYIVTVFSTEFVSRVFKTYRVLLLMTLTLNLTKKYLQQSKAILIYQDERDRYSNRKGGEAYEPGAAKQIVVSAFEMPFAAAGAGMCL